MKHVIFLVHGMGTHGEGWHAAYETQLRGLYASYSGLAQLPFSDHFVVEPVRYDQEFEALRDIWKKSSAGLGSALKKSGVKSALVEMLNRLSGIANKDTFLSTHIGDVLMYFALRQVSGLVRDSVRLQILKGIKKHGKVGNVRWSIIAHSLGTAVVHDSLHGLYTSSSVNPKANFTGVTRPTVLAMIANVSRVMEDGGNFDVYTSRVHPGVGLKAGCLYYLNARHEWDPFTQPKKFAPMSSWPDPETRARQLYVECQLRDIAQVNVHALDHYLADPLVHGPLFNCLHGERPNDGVLTFEAIETAHAQYVLGIRTGLLDLALAKLKPLRVGEEDDWETILKSWIRMRKLG
jgi:hypothetical protein